MQFEEELERFWDKVDVGKPDECWEWRASKRWGYGQHYMHECMWQAHRVAWILTFGAIPEGLLVCHHCDNPGCCNPYHLFLGTQADNLRDAARKGRLFKKLTEGDVEKIRKLLVEGDLQSYEIANLFDVHECVISHIKHGRTWSWLGEKRED